MIEKTRLQQSRSHAIKHRDHDEVVKLDIRIAELEASMPKPVTPAPEPDTVSARLAMVNARNRKANVEAVRRVEQAEAERRRREREQKLASGTATPNKATLSRYVVHTERSLCCGGLMYG